MPLAATTSSTKAVSRKPRLDAMYGPTPHASQGLASHAWDTAAMLTIVLSTAAAGHLLLLWLGPGLSKRTRLRSNKTVTISDASIATFFKCFMSDMAEQERRLTVNVAAPTVVLAVNRLKNIFMGISRSYMVCPTSHLPDLACHFQTGDQLS